MRGRLAGIAWLVAAPLTAAPIMIDGHGLAAGSAGGHLDISGEGVSFSAALAGGEGYGFLYCRAGDLCNIASEGGLGASNIPSDITDVIGTYLGKTITLQTPAQVSVSFRTSVPVHGLPYPSDYQLLSVPVFADWTGQIRIWPDGPDTAGIALQFAGSGPAQAFLEAFPNHLVCPTPPGGWTHQPPDSCFATYFRIGALDGTFKGTLEQTPEPSTWTSLVGGLLFAAVAALKRRRYGDGTARKRLWRAITAPFGTSG